MYLIFFTFIILLILPFIKLIPIVKEESENLQYYVPKLERFVRIKYIEIQRYSENKIGISLGDNLIDDGILNIKEGFKSAIFQVPNYVASVLEWILLVPIFLFFLMKESHNLRRHMLQFVPNQIFERVYYLYSQFHKKLADYILAKFIEASIVGLIIGIGLVIMDVRFAVLLGILAAVTNIIPYVGPLLGTVPALILGMVEYGTGPTFFAIFMLYLIANLVDMALVFPILVSKIVNLHPVVVIVSVILGSQYFGVFGMVASIPLAAVIKLIFEQVYRELYPVQSRQG
jgi:putative permease